MSDLAGSFSIALINSLLFNLDGTLKPSSQILLALELEAALELPLELEPEVEPDLELEPDLEPELEPEPALELELSRVLSTFSFLEGLLNVSDWKCCS